MSERRANLRYSSIADAIRDVQSLRRGAAQTGNWTLPQAAWHVAMPMHAFLNAPPLAGATSTPEQRGLFEQTLKPLLAGAPMPTGIQTPPGTDPRVDAPQNLGPEQIDSLLAALNKLQAYPHATVQFGPFGVISIADFRGFNLIHAAHHLSFFVPQS